MGLRALRSSIGPGRYLANESRRILVAAGATVNAGTCVRARSSVSGLQSASSDVPSREEQDDMNAIDTLLPLLGVTAYFLGALAVYHVRLVRGSLASDPEVAARPASVVLGRYWR